MYKKDFDKNGFADWCDLKCKIDSSLNHAFFKSRDVWFVNVGRNIGFLRPVVVLAKLSSSIFIGVPLTPTIRSGSFFLNFNFNGAKSSAVVAQVRTYSVNRLNNKIGRVSFETHSLLKKKLIKLFE